ncbi:MAG: hypothetical protein OIN87_12600 [Candidatus Methanoperedens sp.]|jgi:hypothetical protein|nr:hypothetical protein [Candidatus Methanoperedens sp.]
MKQIKETKSISETTEIRNKATVCATVSPWLKAKLESVVNDTKQFGSVSDLVSIACMDFLTRNFPDNMKRNE